MEAISKLKARGDLTKPLQLPKQLFRLFSSLSSTTSLPLPNPRTLIQLLKQQPLQLSQIKRIHAQFIAHNYSSNPPPPSLLAALIRSYIISGNLSHARILLLDDRFFPSSPFQSPLLWNQLMQAYCKTGNSHESLLIFRRMLALERPTLCLPDKYTFTFAITACSRQFSSVCGENVHGLVVKFGFETELFVGNALVNLYCVYEKVGEARNVFDEMFQRDVVTWTSLLKGYSKSGQMGGAAELFCKMPERNDVSWTVMIAGYVGDGRYNDALWCFHDMLLEEDEEIKPNEAVLVCVLSACAHLGALDQGKWIHLYIDERGMGQSSNLCNALIDMYARCGRIDFSKRVFDGMGKRNDVFTWTSMIVGLSMHGQGKDALLVFHEMLEEGIRPSSVTLLGVLNACSHSGLVEEGCSIFYNMEPFWGIQPSIEHFGCLIDLLGRAGLLEKAFEVVKSMPMEPDVVICRALLSACRIHGDAGVMERIIDYIAQLDGKVYGGGYMLLSNLYASLGRWETVVGVRKKMNEEKIEQSPGCSWIEVDGIPHQFLSAVPLHPQIPE